MSGARTGTIAPALVDLAVPVGRLEALPGNPRRGDVEAVMRSYERFGQRKPIVARKTGGSARAPSGVVIAGNHQLEAATRLGWPKIAVVWVSDDEATANAYALADNRTSDLAHNEDADLLALLRSLDDELLEAASFTADDLDALAVLTAAPDLDTLIDDVGEPHERDGLRRVVLWLPPELASEITEAIDTYDDEYDAHRDIAERWLNRK